MPARNAYTLPLEPDSATGTPNASRDGYVGAVGPASIRETGLGRRRALLFGRFEEAENGTTELFPLWTTLPKHMAKYSSFLALHFGTLLKFLLLMMLYCLLAAYPLIETIRARSEREDIYNISGQIDTENLNITNCKKEDEALPGFIQQLSIGTFCATNSYADGFECSTSCLLKDFRNQSTGASKVEESRFPFMDADELGCNDVLPMLGKGGEGGVEIVGQCLDWGGREDLGRGWCCAIAANPSEENKDTLAAFMWLWSVGAMLVYLAWLLWLQSTHAGAEGTLARHNVTAADYAVLLQNVGVSDGDDADLEEFGRHYGEVVVGAHVRTVGRVLTKCTEIEKCDLLIKELGSMTALPSPSGAVLRLIDFAYKRWLCLFSSPETALEAARERRMRLVQQQELLEKQELLPTGNALLVFNRERAARNALWDHDRRVTKSWFGKLWPSDTVRAFHIVTGGNFAPTPKLPLSVAGAKTERFVSVSRAPEPGDILWHNMRGDTGVVASRRARTWVLYIIVLAVAFIVQFFLAREAENERRTKITEVWAQEYSDRRLGTDTTGIDQIKLYGKLQAFALVKAVVTSIFGSLGTSLVYWSTSKELQTTTTNEIASSVTKLVLFYLVNSFVVPLAAIVAYQQTNIGEEAVGSLWYARGGFVETAFYIQLFSAILPPLAAVADPLRILNVHLFSHVARTQPAADALLDPSIFPVPDRLAHTVNCIGLAVLYAPILPISPFIGALGVACAYAADQWVALRQSLKLRAFGLEAFTAVARVLRLLPLVQIVLIYALYYKDVDGRAGPFVIGLVLWAGAAVLPFSWLVWGRHKARHDAKTVSLRDRRLPTYLELMAYNPSSLARTDDNGRLLELVTPDVAVGALRLHADPYMPEVGPFPSPQWYDRVRRSLAPVSAPAPIIEEPLRGQDASTTARIAAAAGAHSASGSRQALSYRAEPAAVSAVLRSTRRGRPDRTQVLLMPVLEEGSMKGRARGENEESASTTPAYSAAPPPGRSARGMVPGGGRSGPSGAPPPPHDAWPAPQRGPAPPGTSLGGAGAGVGSRDVSKEAGEARGRLNAPAATGAAPPPRRQAAPSAAAPAARQPQWGQPSTPPQSLPRRSTGPRQQPQQGPGALVSDGDVGRPAALAREGDPWRPPPQAHVPAASISGAAPSAGSPSVPAASSQPRGHPEQRMPSHRLKLSFASGRKGPGTAQQGPVQSEGPADGAGGRREGTTGAAAGGGAFVPGWGGAGTTFVAPSESDSLPGFVPPPMPGMR